MEVCNTVEEAVIKTSPRKRNAKRQCACLRRQVEKRREVKGKGEKERYTHLNAELQRIASRDKKTLLSNLKSLVMIVKEKSEKAGLKQHSKK